MSNTKRLGPQDPLSWIKDTRQERTPDEPERNYLSIGHRNQPSLLSGVDKTPTDITIVIKGEGREKVVAVEVTLDKKGVSKIQIKTGERHQEEKNNAYL